MTQTQYHYGLCIKTCLHVVYLFISREGIQQHTVIWFGYKQTQVMLVHYVCNLALFKTMCGSGLNKIHDTIAQIFLIFIQDKEMSKYYTCCNVERYISSLYTSCAMMFIKGQNSLHVKPPNCVVGKYVPIKTMIQIVHILPQMSQ